MSAPFSEIPQRADASPWMTSRPPRARRPGRLRRAALDDHAPRHHVLGHPDAAVPAHAHGRELVHAGAVVADVTVDLDLVRRVEPDRDARGAHPGCAPGPARRDRPESGGTCSAWLSSRTVSTAGRRSDRLADDLGRSHRHATSDAVPQLYTWPGAGSQVTASSAPGQHRDRPVLGRHRDPLVGLGHHRRLAGDRVAQHREPVGGPDRERVEAVEVVEAALERLLERRALAQAPGQVPGRDLAVVVGPEPDPLAREHPPQPVVVRQRAVVDQAQVQPGRERVRVLGRDPALGGHPGVAERVAAGDLGQREALHEPRRQTGLLVDLDRAPRAHQRELGMALGQPRLRVVGIRRDHEHRVASRARAEARPRRTRPRARPGPPPSRESAAGECSDTLHQPAGAGSR